MKMRKLPLAARYAWIGGQYSGYAILDIKGRELIRIWSEIQAQSVIRTKRYPREFLVSNVIRRLVSKGMITPFE
ncbi:MAG TPA: hypothetical protein VGE62_02705 [Candidatus Paceibacterota bacterium]